MRGVDQRRRGRPLGTGRLRYLSGQEAGTRGTAATGAARRPSNQGTTRPQGHKATRHDLAVSPCHRVTVSPYQAARPRSRHRCNGAPITRYLNLKLKLSARASSTAIWCPVVKRDPGGLDVLFGKGRREINIPSTTKRCRMHRKRGTSEGSRAGRRVAKTADQPLGTSPAQHAHLCCLDHRFILNNSDCNSAVATSIWPQPQKSG